MEDRSGAIASVAAVSEGFAACRCWPPLWSGSSGEPRYVKPKGYATRRHVPITTCVTDDTTQHCTAISCRDERRCGRGSLPCGLGTASTVSSGVAGWASLMKCRCFKLHACEDVIVATCEDQAALSASLDCVVPGHFFREEHIRITAWSVTRSIQLISTCKDEQTIRH